MSPLSFGLKIRAANNPKTTAAVIPGAEAVNPPDKTPISPSLSTASRTPLARRLPKPVKGTVAPAPAKSMRGWYHPSPPKITPATTYATRIRAGVSFV